MASSTPPLRTGTFFCATVELDLDTDTEDADTPASLVSVSTLPVLSSCKIALSLPLFEPSPTLLVADDTDESDDDCRNEVVTVTITVGVILYKGSISIRRIS